MRVMQQGDIVQFGGSDWTVVEIQPHTDTVKLARPSRAPDISMLTFGPQVSLSGRRFEEVEVTAEQLAREQATTVRSMDKFAKWFGHGVFQPPEGGDIWDQLKAFGIRRGENSAMDALNEQAARGQFKSIADLMGDFTTPEQDDEAVLASRKARLDAQFTEPEGEGFFVFYRKPGTEGPDLVFVVDGVKFPPVASTQSVHRCDSIDDAWAFVDYLKDDEAGEAICIREDSCVLFYRGDAGWEALTRDPVPDEYREEE
jgi:hypothetical protein